MNHIHVPLYYKYLRNLWISLLDIVIYYLRSQEKNLFDLIFSYLMIGIYACVRKRV